MRSIQISILNEQKTLIQFAHHGEQFAYFIRLVSGAIYDLSCNSVCSPRCSIHLLRKSSDLQGYLLKTVPLS